MYEGSCVGKSIKRTLKKFFREFLVYNHSSLEYRAKIITLIVSANGEMCECQKQKLKEIARKIYKKNEERAEMLIEMVKEYHDKIVTNNGLDFEHLIQLVEKETKSVKRFADKIDIDILKELHACIDDEEERLFQEHILEFLTTLKNEYGTN